MKTIVLTLAVSLCLASAASAGTNTAHFSEDAAQAAPTGNVEEAPLTNTERRAALQQALDRAQKTEEAQADNVADIEKKKVGKEHKVNKIKSELLNTPIN